MGKITFKTGAITFKGGTITFKSSGEYVITSGLISGGTGTGTLNESVSYSIKCNGNTIKNGTASNGYNESALLTNAERNLANSEMGTDGGTFVLTNLTDIPGSWVELKLTYTINGAGAYTSSDTAHNDSFNVNYKVGNIVIPA